MPNIKSGDCMHGPTNMYRVATPIGEVVIVSCPQGLHNIDFPDGLRDGSFSPDERVKVSIVNQRYHDNGYVYQPVTQSLQWLQAYFNGQIKSGKVTNSPEICPCVITGDTFVQRVWFTLQHKVPFGQTVSYKTLAGMCGNVRACRAVGQAMSKNPIPLVIPCHRVIQQSGCIGNYSQGTRNSIKRWLLKHEGALST